jgi:hypothetical protein
VGKNNFLFLRNGERSSMPFFIVDIKTGMWRLELESVELYYLMLSEISDTLKMAKVILLEMFS